MKPKRRFTNDILAAIRESKILGIRAGTQPHRTFLEEPRGAIQIAGREIAARAVRTRSERLKDAVDRAYLEKYNTPAAIKYARNLGRAKSRATTTELVPF